MALSEKEMEVLINIIGAVETGGQVYGKRRYDDFTEAYANASTEHAITISAYQHYADEAKELLLRIQKADPALFKKLDTSGVATDLSKSWARYNIKKTSAKAKCIINIISSDVGKKVQDQMTMEQMAKFIQEAENLGVTDHQAQCMCANWRHQGGYGAVKRIIAKTKKPYNLDNLYEACKTDTGNQVGAYKTRQKLVYNWLKTYWPTENEATKPVKETTTAAKPVEDTKTTTTTVETNKKTGYNKTAKWTGKVTADSLSLRTGPGTEYDRLKSYPYVKKNTKLIICDTTKNSKSDTWYYIKYKDKYGFASGKYITKV